MVKCGSRLIQIFLKTFDSFKNVFFHILAQWNQPFFFNISD